LAFKVCFCHTQRITFKAKKSSMQEIRKKITFSLSPDTIEALRAGAKVDGRNLSRYAEAIFIDFLKIKPKQVKKPVKPETASARG